MGICGQPKYFAKIRVKPFFQIKLSLAIIVSTGFKLKQFGCIFTKFLVLIANDLVQFPWSNIKGIFEVTYIIKAPKNEVLRFYHSL